MPNDTQAKSGTVEEVFAGFLANILQAAHEAANKMLALKTPPEVPAEVTKVTELPPPTIPPTEIMDPIMPPEIPDELDAAIDAKVRAEQAPVKLEPEVAATEVPVEEDDDDLFDMDDDDDMAGAEAEEATDPELDHLRAGATLDYEDVQFPKNDKPVMMYAVDSSHMLHIGRVIKQKQPDFCTLYVNFKGNNYYRYGPVTLKTFEEILGEAVRKAEGRVECSVGSVFHNLVKSEADTGTIKCQRLDKENKRWVEVPPKAERVKAVKEKHGK